MNYPLISEYIEAIKSAEDNFEELSYLRPVLDDDGLPVMTSGNFAVIFKMKDDAKGKFYALKCFTREQEGRAEAYRQITEELENVDSPYLVPIRYLEKELFVDTAQTDETEFPVLLMDWVEGKTLDKYLRENLDDKYALEMLAYRFSQLSQWLIPQPFAHGDLKPDNILVRDDGTLVFVDYDGMYVPAMKGQKARELGSPDFRHPLRTENDFDEHIDDFTLVTIVFSLKLITVLLKIQDKQISFNLPIISAGNYQDVEKCILLEKIDSVSDDETKKLCKIFLKSCKTYNQTTIGTEFLGIYKMQRYEIYEIFVIFILLLLTFIILYFIYFIIKLFLQSDVVLPLTWSFIYLITILIGSLFAYSGKELGCTKPGCGCFLLCIFMFLGAKLATWIVNCLFEL